MMTMHNDISNDKKDDTYGSMCSIVYSIFSLLGGGGTHSPYLV